MRAEKGYTYGASGIFQPGRHAGIFEGSVDTNPDTTAPCIEAMFKVFSDLRNGYVTPEELAQSKQRVAGGMVMNMQTIARNSDAL